MKIMATAQQYRDVNNWQWSPIIIEPTINFKCYLYEKQTKLINHWNY